jgi:hypothetical protein
MRSRPWRRGRPAESRRARPSDALSSRAAGFVLLVLGAVLFLLAIQSIDFPGGGPTGRSSDWALVVGVALVLLGVALAVRPKPY